MRVSKWVALALYCAMIVFLGLPLFGSYRLYAENDQCNHSLFSHVTSKMRGVFGKLHFTVAAAGFCGQLGVPCWYASALQGFIRTLSYV